MISSISDLVSSIPPPPGSKSNFANPDCDRNSIYIPLTICLGVTTIFFFMRAFTKGIVMRQIDVEDCKFGQTPSSSRLTSALICSYSVGYASSFE